MEELIRSLPKILSAAGESGELDEAAALAAWKYVAGDGLRNHSTATAPPHVQLIEMTTASWAAVLLHAAAKFGLADHLADGPRSAADLAGPTNTHAPSLHRLMRTLASLGVLTEDAEHRFRLTPLGEALKTGAPGSARATLLTFGSGFFWRAHCLERDRWFTMRVSCLDSQRVAPGYVTEIAQRYGMDSNAYRVRVLGECPVADADTVMPASLVDDAMTRDVPLDPSMPVIWGVDVARFGSDASVLIKRHGNVVPEMPRRWRQFDTMQLAGALKSEYDSAGAGRPNLIVIDVIGIGAGVVDRLHEQNLPILGVNVAEVASTTGRYARLRDELWVRCREWLESRAVRLPRADDLRADLVAPRYQFLSDGRMQVESKNSMRGRSLPSPDSADALIHTFAEQGLGIASGMTSGLFDSNPVRMNLTSGDYV